MTVAERLFMTPNERIVWMAVYATIFAKTEYAEPAFEVADKAVLEMRAMFAPNIW